MKAISHVEQEVNKIRLQIYEETKDMTIQERVASANDNHMQAARAK